MKRTIFLSFLLVVATMLSGQVPGKLNYQAVVRDASGAVIAEQSVSFKFSILFNDINGDEVYMEEQDITTDQFGVASLTLGKEPAQSQLLREVDWGAGDYFLKVEVDPAGEGNDYQPMGTSQLISVPYALASGSLTSPTRKFTIMAEPGHDPEEALFEVVNESGQVLFAVYPEGTRVYIDDNSTKALKGGFAVGGYSDQTKGITQEFLRVTPDSVRIYLKEPAVKGVKGGFAVGGYSDNDKAGEFRPHLFVNKDSTDVYTEDPVVGGFNVKLATYEKSKGNRDHIMGVHTQNSFIGYEAGYANKGGIKNSYIGYRAGYENLSGVDNVFIGTSAGFASQGSNNVYLGANAGASNTAGTNNIFIGNRAGELEPGSHRLYIESDDDMDFGSALIYGEFDTDKVRINSSLGVGITPTNYTFEVDGNVAKSDPEDWNTISDHRVKREIEEIRDACSTIMKLRPVTYRYSKAWMKKHPTLQERKYYNYIAQEFNEVFPDAVHQVDKYIEGDDEPLYEMNSQPASIVAIKAIQELIEENRKQQEMIDELKRENAELDALKKRLEQLERKVR